MDNNQEVVTHITSEIEAKKAKLGNWVKGGTLGVTGLVVAPVILMVLGGVIGLIVSAAIGFLAVQLAPYFAQKVANYKYRLMDAERIDHIKKVTAAAAENPIETLTSMLIEKKKAFQTFKTSVETGVTVRSNFANKVEKFKQKYPARAPEFEKQLQRMTDMVEQKKVALKEAQSSLDLGDQKLEEMKAYYEMSKDAIEMNRAAGMDTGDAFEKLKADTACDAVFTQMNAAFAQLEVAAALDVNSADHPTQSVAQLAHSESVVFDMNTTKVSDTQKVSR
jgi:archaellum component FlaC